MSQSAKSFNVQGPTARRGRARAAGEDALAHAAAAFGRAGFADGSLLLRWAEIAGADVARIARPLKLQQGERGAVLCLLCDPGAAVLLQHQTRELIGRINAYLGSGRVTRLKLVPGRLGGIAEPPAHPRFGRQPIASQEPIDKYVLSRALDRLGALRGTGKNARAALRPD